MTYDRNYSWSKEFYENVESIAQKHNFKILKTEKIKVENVKLSIEKSLKIEIKNMLNKIGLMNFGTEYGEKIQLVSQNSNENLVFKSWCLSDHIIGIEVEEKNISAEKLKVIRKNTEETFDNYKIIWTKK